MRPFKLVAALFFTTTTSIVFSACGQGSGSDSTGSGGDQCANIYLDWDMCGQCAVKKCCAEAAACQAKDNCVACHFGLGNFNHPPCQAAAVESNALTLCSRARCKYECSPELFCTEGDNRSDGGGCVDTEPEGGVTTAECQGQNTVIVRGTLDGKPFELAKQGLVIQPEQESAQGSITVGWLNLVEGATYTSGKIDLNWLYVCVYPDGVPVPVTGTMQTPYNISGPVRPLAACSLIWRTTVPVTQHDIYGFHLRFDNGDEITGCERAR